MVGAVGSALAQEGMSGLSSYISSKLEEKASREHMLARLQAAVARLEFALEFTGKRPITSVSLLRRRKDIERAYNQGTFLLSKHKLPVLVGDLGQSLKGAEDIGQQVVTQSSSPFLERFFGRARSFITFLPNEGNFTISSLLGLSTEHYLSSSVVRNYECYADCADKFLRDVEFGCPLRQGACRYRLVRYLLEGKTLMYEMVKKERQSLFFHIWSMILEGRGVEAVLLYSYQDFRLPENYFFLCLSLRISEDTDIVGTAVKCVQFLTSQFNFVVESVIGEHALLSDLQDISHSYAPPPLCCTKEEYSIYSKKLSPRSTMLQWK